MDEETWYEPFEPAPMITVLDALLERVDAPGEFYAAGEVLTPLPMVEVEGLGALSFPLREEQARQLIALASRAPYGRGAQTLVDTEVRSSWQLSPSLITIEDDVWQPTLDELVARAKRTLGVEVAVSAELYKMLIYEEGGFFKEHRDSEKTPGMFATLVVVLPSPYEGGELVIRHQDHEVSLPMASASTARLPYAAFYTDCRHELLPVSAGYRLCLVYNLSYEEGAGRPAPADLRVPVELTAAMLEPWARASERDLDQLVYVLEHAYTPSALSWDALKNRDASVAQVLTRAAEKAGCVVYLTMLSISQTGSAEPEYDWGYKRSRRWGEREEEEREERFEIIEIDDQIERLTQWSSPDGEVPIGALAFEARELCPVGVIDELEPDEVHFSEATGNGGASFERIYRRAALVVWPQELELLNISQGSSESVQHVLAQIVLAYLSARVDHDDARAAHHHARAVVLAGHIIARREPVPYYYDQQRAEQDDRFVRALIRLAQPELVARFIERLTEVGLTAIGALLVEAAHLIDADEREPLLIALINAQLNPKPDSAITLWRSLASSEDAADQRVAQACATLVVARLDATSSKPGEQLTQHFIIEALRGLSRQDDAQAQQATAHLVAHAALEERFVDDRLLPALLELEQDVLAHPAYQALREQIIGMLEARVSAPLDPPADMRRALPIKCKCADCAALRAFMADPKQEQLTLAINQTRRSHVQNTVLPRDYDLEYQEILVGSPYKLQVTKTQASYERHLKKRNAELSALATIKAALS